MSFLTDINLGIAAHVLAILLAPLHFGRQARAPWTMGLAGTRRRIMSVLITGAVGLTIAASALIYPDYLAYFNWASGGPDEKPARLIDSNLDWGQDLVALQKWWKKTIPGQPIGLAYFGQINPAIFKLRGESFDWFLPPVKPDAAHPMAQPPNPLLIGPSKKLTPGYYAVSVTLLYGLSWRLYDPISLNSGQNAWAPTWNVARRTDAFWYFRQFEPIRRIGHSIYIYHLTARGRRGRGSHSSWHATGKRSRYAARIEAATPLNFPKSWNKSAATATLIGLGDKSREPWRKRSRGQ